MTQSLMKPQRVPDRSLECVDKTMERNHRSHVILMVIENEREKQMTMNSCNVETLRMERFVFERPLMNRRLMVNFLTS